MAILVPWRAPVRTHMMCGRVRNFKANRKRSLSKWCFGVSRERKDKHLGQELQRKREKRISIVQDGGSRRDRRKTRGQSKSMIEDVFTEFQKEREGRRGAHRRNATKFGTQEPLKLNGNSALWLDRPLLPPGMSCETWVPGGHQKLTPPRVGGRHSRVVKPTARRQKSPNTAWSHTKFSNSIYVQWTPLFPNLWRIPNDLTKMLMLPTPWSLLHFPRAPCLLSLPQEVTGLPGVLLVRRRVRPSLCDWPPRGCGGWY